MAECWCRRAACLLVALCSGCNLAPHYQTPAPPALPATWLESGPWTRAAPADQESRGAWWTAFADPELNHLEDRLQASSPRLDASVARFDQANAAARAAYADLYPTITANANAERGRTVMYGDEHDYAGGFLLHYEADLWGRVRNEVAAGRAEAQASLADLASVRLSLQAELAEQYMGLTSDDADARVVAASVDAYAQALDLTERAYRGGAVSELDVDRARTQLADAKAQLDQVGADRAERQHAIADLLGLEPASLPIPPTASQDIPPVLPVYAPATLLQRRPDVAAAERRIFAANARVGQARAAFFPTLNLGASGGYEQILGTLLTASGFIWALGPAAVAVAVFDAGRNAANLRRARGAEAEVAADYRQTVLDALRDVEDQMALINHLALSAGYEDEAVEAAARTTALATLRYKGGASDYLDVVTAQTAELQARRTAVGLRNRRLLASVDLIRALGGGWQQEIRSRNVSGNATNPPESYLLSRRP